MTDLELLVLLMLAAAGAITNALLGWAESGQSFDARKFIPSLIRAGISAIVVFLGTIVVDVESVTIIMYVGAFLSGMGIDTAGNRIAGIFGKQKFSQKIQF